MAGFYAATQQHYAAAPWPTFAPPHTLVPYYELNRCIHEEIVRLSGNTALAAIYAQTNTRIRRARFITPLPVPAWDKAMAEHVGIINALERRDGTTTASILKTHLGNKSKVLVAAGYACAEPVGS